MTPISMASAISTPTYLYQSTSSSTIRKPTLYTLSTCISSKPKTLNFCFPTWVPQVGLSPFSPWNGLRHLGISISRPPVKLERKRKCKGKAVFASLFGVGAPEALVIGVVALLVFGPKGLAEVARTLGQTLRAFQPTIRELKEVSREFKSTLEREVGLDDIQSQMKDNYGSNTTNTAPIASPIANSEDSQIGLDDIQSQMKDNYGSNTTNTAPIAKSEDSQMIVDPTDGLPSSNKAYSSEDYVKITEDQLKASTHQQQKEQSTSLQESQFEPQTQSQDIVQETAAVMPPLQLAQKQIRET